MPIHQITILGTGLIGGSFGLALKRQGFGGRIVGYDRPGTLEKAIQCGAIDAGSTHPFEATRGSQVVLLAAPVSGIVDLIQRLGPVVPSATLITDVGSTKAAIMAAARKTFGHQTGARFLGGHPMAGKEQSGVEFADPDLFRGAVWFITPVPGQELDYGASGDFLYWVDKMGARVARIDAEEHDHLCAWISHLPQMVSTALAAALVDEYGSDAPLLEAGGRALREMTRISSSPYSMWRDIAITNKKNIREVLLKLEQHLVHIRENLDSRELAMEFDQAHSLRKLSPRSHGDPEK